MLTARLGRSPNVHILEEYSRGYGMALCGLSGQASLSQQAPTCDACQGIWTKQHPEEKDEHGTGTGQAQGK